MFKNEHLYSYGDYTIADDLQTDISFALIDKTQVSGIDNDEVVI